MLPFQMLLFRKGNINKIRIKPGEKISTLHIGNHLSTGFFCLLCLFNFRLLSKINNKFWWSQYPPFFQLALFNRNTTLILFVRYKHGGANIIAMNGGIEWQQHSRK